MSEQILSLGSTLQTMQAFIEGSAALLLFRMFERQNKYLAAVLRVGASHPTECCRVQTIVAASASGATEPVEQPVDFLDLDRSRSTEV